MEIITGRTGIKHVRAADDARIYRMLFGSGDYVLQDGSQLIAAKTGSNQVTISDGFLMTQGRLAGIYSDKGADIITIDSGNSGSKREDIIVAEYSITTQGIESISLKVVKGVSGTAYVTPDLITGVIDNKETHQVPLWGVRMDGFNMEDTLIDYRKIITINPIDQLYADIKTYMQQMNDKAAELESSVDAKVTELTSTVNTTVTTLQNSYNQFTKDATTTITNTINDGMSNLRPIYGQANDNIGFAFSGGGFLSDGTKVWFSVPIRPTISGAYNPVLKNLKLSIRVPSGGHAISWVYTDSSHTKWNLYTMSWNGSSNITDSNGNITHPAVQSVSASRSSQSSLQICVTFKYGLCKPDGKTYLITYLPLAIDTQGYYQL